MLILRQLNVTGDFKKQVKLYAVQNDHTIQEVAQLALNNILKEKRIGYFYAAFNRHAPELLLVRIPENTIKRANAMAKKHWVSFPDVLFTALIRLIEA